MVFDFYRDLGKRMSKESPRQTSSSNGRFACFMLSLIVGGIIGWMLIFYVLSFIFPAIWPYLVMPFQMIKSVILGLITPVTTLLPAGSMAYQACMAIICFCFILALMYCCYLFGKSQGNADKFRNY